MHALMQPSTQHFRNFFPFDTDITTMYLQYHKQIGLIRAAANLITLGMAEYTLNLIGTLSEYLGRKLNQNVL